MSKVVVHFNFPCLTVEEYNNIIAQSEPLRKASYPGRLLHVAAPNGTGMFVCDVWENEACFNVFGAMMLPVLIRAGGKPVSSTICPVHNIINELS